MRWLLLIVVAVVALTVTDACGRRRRRRRRPPPNRPPSIHCPNVDDVTASPMRTSAEVYWNSPQASDDRGGVDIYRTSGPSSGSTFSEGTHSIHYKVVDSGGLTDTCYVSFTVRVVRCSGLSTPGNGHMKCDGNRVYGRTCRFSCDDGYWLDGASSSTCKSNGYNTHSEPSCRKKRCSDIHRPPKSTGTHCTDGNYYSSFCSLHCDSANGYTPRHKSFAQCRSNTKWEYGSWYCDDTERPKILNCPDGELKTSDKQYTWPTIRASDNSGSVTLSQKRGQKPGSAFIEGLQIIEYRAVDPSGNSAPPCVFSVTFTPPECGAPVEGGGDYDPQFTCHGHGVGDACKANCATTYVVGAKHIQCQKSTTVVADSIWVGFKGPFPTCYKTPCPDLDTPVNGALVCDKFFGGSSCQVHCNENYDVPEDMKYLTSLQCGNKKGWSPTNKVPDCTVMSYPDYYNLPTEVYYYGGECSDSQTHTEIQENYLENLVQTAQLMCIPDTCTIENVKVTCGPVDDDVGEDDYLYYDDDEEGVEDYDEDFDDVDEDYPENEAAFDEKDDGPKVVSRKRRDVTDIQEPSEAMKGVQGRQKRDSVCGGDWVSLHRACYKFDERLLTWDLAKANCLEEGANLMSISSNAEKTKITRALQRQEKHKLNWWLGLRYDNETRNFNWEDGGPFSQRTTRWASGEPHSLRGRRQYCGQIKHDGKLNDAECSDRSPFICERHEIGRPTDASETEEITTETPTAQTTSTSDFDFSLSDTGSGGSDDLGSGEVPRKRRKPTSRNSLTFNLVIGNVTRVMTAEQAVDLSHKITNSTMNLVVDNKVRFKPGHIGDFQFTCGPGRALSNNSADMCVPCPRGSYQALQNDSHVCRPCPSGSYTNTSGQTSCTRCDVNLSTLTNGSRSSEECIPMCSPGGFSESGLVPCTPCPRGTFQSEVFAKQCTPCPPDSTTLALGAQSVDKCIPFDVMVKGPSQLSLGQVIPEWVEQVTLAFWIRTLPSDRGYANVSFTLSHPTRGQQITLGLERHVTVKMRQDVVPIEAHFPQDIWTHVAFVWQGFPRYLGVFIGGKPVVNHTDPTPNLFLPKGTELTIDIGEDSSATLREIYVIPHSDTIGLIRDMAATCTPTSTQGYDSLLTRTATQDPNKISIVVPSVCSEIDRCTPDPCPGHYCRSFKYDFQCVCKGGYSGKDCSTPPDYCVVDNKCENEAECTNIEAGVNCTCTDDFKGEFCQTPIVHGNWGPWTSWSECSLTCGVGERSRSRECNNPRPEPGYGKPCPGVAREVSVCNTDRCPECLVTQLQVGRGISLECVNITNGGLNCSVQCEDGLVLPQEPPAYVCRQKVWTPATKTLSCVEFSVPDSVSFVSTLPYKTRVTNSSEEDQRIIRSTVGACAAKATCAIEETCEFDVAVETCLRENGGCAEFPEGYKALLGFSVPVVASNVSVTETKQNLMESYDTLNATYSELEEMPDCFEILLQSGSLKPGTVVVDDDLTCPQGLVPDQGYCSACGLGTKEVNGTCLQCDRGWYQDQTGQLTCDQCPAAFNTQFLGTEERALCLAPPADAFMLVTDPVAGHVWSVNMSRFLLEPVSLPDNMITSTAAYDPVTKQVFFANRARPAIHGVGPRRSEIYVTLNWAASVDGISVDPVSRLIFYTDKGNDVIGVVTMVKKHHKVILRSMTYMPRRIAVDPSRGELYWIDWGDSQKIERANYDGSGRQVLLESTTIRPVGLSLDLQARQLYWSDWASRTVERMDLSGSNRTTIVSPGTSHPASITIFQDYIFYAAIAANNSVVMRVNKDGSGSAVTELPPFRYISDMQSHTISDFEGITNGCSKKNGNCAFLCFPKPGGETVCACPEGYSLDDDRVNCSKASSKKTGWWNVWMKPRRRRHISRRHH